MLLALDLLINDTQEVVLVTKQPNDRKELKQSLYSGFVPRRTIAYINPADPNANADALKHQATIRTLIDDQATVYICQDFSCQKPLSNRGEIESAFDTMKASFS